MAIVRKLFKSGNSTVVALPDAYLHRYGLRAGDHMRWDIGVKDNLRLQPVEWRGNTWRKRRRKPGQNSTSD